jgi:hypothetical protein
MVPRIQERQTFATQPDVKFHWDQGPLNPQTTIPLNSLNPENQPGTTEISHEAVLRAVLID